MHALLKCQKVKQPSEVFAEKMTQFVSKKNQVISDLRQQVLDCHKLIDT
jgi:hypothetical protein